MGIFKRLLGRLRSGGAPVEEPRPAGGPVADPRHAEPRAAPGGAREEEAPRPPAQRPGQIPLGQLQELVRQVEGGRAGDVALIEGAALPLAEALAQAGLERVAVERLEHLLALRPDLPGVRMRLAALLLELGLADGALGHLERLITSPRHRIEAHMLLGEHQERRVGGAAGEAEALRHYEAVLAHDFSNRRARGRADNLRRSLETVPFQAGATLLGPQDLGRGSRYTILEQLGWGGGGTVYRAEDRQLGRTLALKVLHPHVSNNIGAREHLLCEARIASSLSHPGIVTIYDLDEALNMVVMEYCAGGPLGTMLPLPADRAMGCLARVAEILDVVHRCGVVHCDLKPANLLLRRAGDPRSLVLTDFGVARVLGEGSPGPEGEDPGAGGTLVYMSPEQRRGAPPDPAMDIYALGVLLLEMLLGHPPRSPRQALAEEPLLNQPEVWDELERVLATESGSGARVMELARSMVHPARERRPSGAAKVCEVIAGFSWIRPAGP